MLYSISCKISVAERRHTLLCLQSNHRKKLSFHTIAYWVFWQNCKFGEFFQDVQKEYFFSRYAWHLVAKGNRPHQETSFWFTKVSILGDGCLQCISYFPNTHELKLWRFRQQVFLYPLMMCSIQSKKFKPKFPIWKQRLHDRRQLMKIIFRCRHTKFETL